MGYSIKRGEKNGYTTDKDNSKILLLIKIFFKCLFPILKFCHFKNMKYIFREILRVFTLVIFFFLLILILLFLNK